MKASSLQSGRRPLCPLISSPVDHHAGQIRSPHLRDPTALREWSVWVCKELAVLVGARRLAVPP